MVAAAQKSRHVAVLAGSPRFAGPLGSISHVDATDLPILHRMSIRRLVLEAGGLREPHWHANANELGYCLRGEALVTIAGNHAQRDSFTVTKGEMFFVPSGTMHCIENIGQYAAEFVLAFSHEKPEDFGLRASFAAMPDGVLGNTYDLPAGAFETFDRKGEALEILTLPRPTPVEAQARHVNRYKYSIEAAAPQIDFHAGTAHTTNASLWPALKDIAMYSVTISTAGMREPHWHPETAEMGYVAAGTVRMTILDPDGGTDTYTIGPGNTYFIPRAYPHHIENVGEGTAHLLIFFDQVFPGDVGYRTLIDMFPRPVVAATLGIAEKDLPEFPFTQIDPLLVDRINPKT
ncbi:cupin domain-containing protein [Mesorhizobium sp. VNQ89]|uniref:cupin domain-containing protein n=1 Tax=Mesorhizobium quangtriensis TaxID=3157709 RepID=UPI0032B75A22